MRLETFRGLRMVRAVSRRLDRTILSLAGAILFGATDARAVIFASTEDATFNTTAPTGQYADSGWQFQGRFTTASGAFLGTPIAPRYFITAEHISGSVGNTFVYRGVTYTTDAFYDDPNSDLRIWRITGTFPEYAPLYLGSDEVGKELTVFGLGTKRGKAVSGKGWEWGGYDGVQRWGTNTVAGIVNGGSSYGSLLTATFDLGGSATPYESTLSLGDSGGGSFIKDSDGVWKLAGVNFSVSGPYKRNKNDAQPFSAAFYDQSGYYVQQLTGEYVEGSGPGLFYSTRISSNMAFIRQITGIPEPGIAGTLAAGLVAMGCLRVRRC